MEKPSKHLALAALVCLASCSETNQIPLAFVGTWQSDEELTLISMRQSDSVSESDMKIFEDNFFGDRIMIFGEYESGAYFQGSGQKPAFSPNDIADSGEDFMILRIPPTEYGGEREQAWYVEGDLIYAYIEKWKFREYFRRIDDQ